MSFGFSVSDFVTLGSLALELHRSYESAPAEYRSLVGDLDVFGGLVVQFTNDVRIPTSPLNRCSPEQQLQLVTILGRVNQVLRSLRDVRDRYPNFQSQPRFFDRLSFPRVEVRALQANLHLQVSGMKLFLGSLTVNVLGRIVTILEDQDRFYQADWGTVLTSLAERGINGETAARYRGQLEEHFQAIHQVAESQRELSEQTNSHEDPFESELSDEDTTHVDSESNADLDAVSSQHQRRSAYVGPPTAQHFISRLCDGAVSLQSEMTGGIKQVKHDWRSGGDASYKYKLRCTRCYFVGFQQTAVDDLIKPTNTPLFFMPRQKALSVQSLEYHLEARKIHHKEVDGLFYRTIFFWKCHVPAGAETRHSEGEYECPLCPVRLGAGIIYRQKELLEHILIVHIQNQPSEELRRRFNIWIEDSPALFEQEHGRTRGRNYDLLIPRPFSRAEGYRARITRDNYNVDAANRAPQRTGVVMGTSG